MKTTKTLLLGILVAVVPLTADAKLGRSGDANVSFTASGPGGMQIVGSTSELNLSDDGTTVTVSVPMRNLTTGIALRDKHMKEKYLQVDRFTTAELSVARSALKVPANGEAGGDATGTMKLHGQTKSVTFHYMAKRDGGSLKVAGTVHVNMSDYGMEIPSFMGVKVKPDVDVTVKFGAQE